MSYTSNFNLNWRVSYLESIISGIIPFLPLNLANVLLIGNSAGASDIDLNSNDLLNVSTISGAGGSLQLNASTTTINSATTTIIGDVGIEGILDLTSAILADRRIDLNGGEIRQASLIQSDNNADITIEGRGTGDVILETATIPRLTISETGLMTFQGGMTYNNATNTVTGSNWGGNINITDTATNATFYPVFTSDDGQQILRINKAPIQLIYNPATDTLTCSNFAGNASTASTSTTATNANNALVTSDNTSGTYFIPFTKTSGTGNKALFQDDTTGPLTYDPSTATLTATNFAGNASTATTTTNANNALVTSDDTNGTYYIPFVKTSGTGNKALFMDDVSGPLSYNPDTQVLSLGASATGNGGQYFVRGPVGDVALRIVADGGAISREVSVVPKSFAGAYNPSVALDDILLVGASGAGNGTGVLRISTNSLTNSSIRLSGTAVLMGAGGTGATATTSITTDGSIDNIIMNTGNATRLTIDATGNLIYNYWDAGNPFLFDDWTSVETNGAFSWFITTVGAGSRVIYEGALDTTAAGNLQSLSRRLGLLNVNTGTTINGGVTCCSGSRVFRPAQLRSITWGFVDCGTGSLASLVNPSTDNVVKTFGLSGTSTPTGNDTQNGIFFRCNSLIAGGQWELVENNVALAPMGLSSLNNAWRATIEFRLNAGNYEFRGIMVGLGTGTTQTSNWFVLTNNPTTGTTDYFAYFNLRTTNATAKIIGVDYILIQTNTPPINRGAIGTATR